MRVSTASMYDDAVANLQKRQRDLAQAQASMTDGKRIHTASDDPSGAARAQRALVAGMRIDADQRAVDTSRGVMTLAESTLGQSVDVLQQVRETLVSAGNGSYTASERKAQADHLKQMRAQLMQLANRDDGLGGYVFGGQTPGTPPFVDGVGGVTAASTGGVLQMTTQNDTPLTVDGPNAWLAARTGNGVFETQVGGANTGSGWVTAGSVTNPALITGDPYQITFGGAPGALTYSITRAGGGTAATNVPYVSGRSIGIDGMELTISGTPAPGDTFGTAPSTPTLSAFAALDRAIAVLSNPAASDAQAQQAVTFGLRDTDAALSQLQSVRGATGAALNRLDSAEARNQDRKLWAKTIQSTTEDGDMVQLISDFQNQQTGYQSALQSYAMVQRMSLLDYVK